MSELDKLISDPGMFEKLIDGMYKTIMSLVEAMENDRAKMDAMAIDIDDAMERIKALEYGIDGKKVAKGCITPTRIQSHLE